MAKKSTVQSFTSLTASKSCSVEYEKLPDATLMLLGKTGAGKSSLGNVILNLGGQGGFAVTQGFDATEIYQAVVKKATFNNRIVTVVDTPGVMDTNFDKEGNEEKVLDGICGGIARCPDGVDAFLIVMQMDLRLTKQEFEAIAKLEILFGEEFWRHAILVFTHGDCVDNDVSKMEAALSESRQKIKALDELLEKLKTSPLLVDASRRRESGVVVRQMTALRLTVDQLMRDNGKKYTNDIFKVAKAALTTRKNAELEEKQREMNQEVLQLMKTVARLQEEKLKMEATHEEERMKMAELRDKERRSLLEALEETKKQMLLKEKEAREKLLGAEKQAMDIEMGLRKKMEQAQAEIRKLCSSRKECHIL